MRSGVVVLLGCLPLVASVRVSVRTLERSEARNACPKVASLCAENILGAEGRNDQALLANALRADLSRKLAVGSNTIAVLLAEDNGETVGCAAIEACPLSPNAISGDRLGREGALDAGVEPRPLLTSLAVDPKYRRKGLGRRLCKEAEALAKDWGYDEVLLKVESDNRKAQNLYRKVGYRTVYVDKEAERPEAGTSGVKFVPTVQYAMRKSLRYPPLDTIVTAVATLATAAAVFVGNRVVLVQAWGLLIGGNVGGAVDLASSLVPATLLEQLTMIR